MHAELEVQPEESGLALGTLLKQRGYSRRLVTRLKRTEGGITRDGVLLRTIDSVSAGDIIILSCPDSKLLEPACGLEVPVIFEDSELVVFNKPPAMPYTSASPGKSWNGRCEQIPTWIGAQPTPKSPSSDSGLTLIGKCASATPLNNAAQLATTAL